MTTEQLTDKTYTVQIKQMICSNSSLVSIHWHLSTLYISISFNFQDLDSDLQTVDKTQETLAFCQRSNKTEVVVKLVETPTNRWVE